MQKVKMMSISIKTCLWKKKLAVNTTKQAKMETKHALKKLNQTFTFTCHS